MFTGQNIVFLSIAIVNKEPKADSLVYYRLIALWALNEAMLGGIIHALKIPVSGLIVGSCAVICICLIGWYVPRKGAIIQATLIVAIFKMTLSPQSPPPAYIAVFFQGLMGELLFWNRRLFKFSCLLLGVLALVESGLQRIFVLTIVYGNDLWKAVNDFINKLTGQKSVTNYSLWLAIGYAGLHLVAGILVGWWAGRLPHYISKWRQDESYRIVINTDSPANIQRSSKRRRKLNKGLLITWLLLILLYVQSYFRIGAPLLPSHLSLKILLRSFIIILSWVVIIAPLLTRLLHYWLQKKKSKSQGEVGLVLQLLPSTQQLIKESWKHSAGLHGWKKIAMTGKMILANSLHPFDTHGPKKIFILTGPIQTGKTSSLVSWSEKRSDVFGILTPVVNGKRMFMDAHSRALFAMEAAEGEKEVLAIGKFLFSRANFAKAEQAIRDAMDKEGWLVIDEIGPLELKEQGFCQVVRELCLNKNEKRNVLLVVREGMAENVISFFGLKNVLIIRSVQHLSDEQVNAVSV